MSEEIHKKYIDLINSENVMTLSTSLKESNWSTPVFYIFKNPCFYFLSAMESKHVNPAESNPVVSVSIFKNDSSWEGLKGVQMKGVQKRVVNLIDASKILKIYFSKYPFTKELFNVDQLIKLSHKKIKLFEFKPAKIIYTDNSIEFGFKKEIKP
jgi:uncharacterized protein YhbP (UPF0306 family)